MKRTITALVAFSLLCALFALPAHAVPASITDISPGIKTYGMIREEGASMWQSTATLQPDRVYEFQMNLYNVSDAVVSNIRISVGSLQPVVGSNTSGSINGVVYVGAEPTAFVANYRTHEDIHEGILLDSVPGSGFLILNGANNWNISDNVLSGGDIVLPGTYKPGWIADLKFKFKATTVPIIPPIDPPTPNISVFAEIYDVNREKPGVTRITPLEVGEVYEFKLHISIQDTNSPLYLFFCPLPTAIDGNLTIGGAVETHAINSPISNMYFGAFATTTDNMHLSYVPGSGMMGEQMSYGAGGQPLPDSFGMDGMVRLFPDEPDQLFDPPDWMTISSGKITVSFQFTVMAEPLEP